MPFPPTLLRIAGLPANTLSALNCLPEENEIIGEETYVQFYYQTVVKLCQISQNLSLRNGLQMTSHSLAGRAEKIINHLPQNLRKKEQQTARSLWQIVSRMTGKTSPFSSFTHLGIFDKNEENPGTIHHRFRLNNILLGQLLEILRYHPPFFQNQRISLNYTTKLVDGKYVFLHNTRNVESVQHIDEQPVIDFIVNYLNNKESVSFQKLVEIVLDEVVADNAEITDYIFSLAEYGLLVWELPVSPSAENWWQPLAENLSNFSDDPLCKKLEKTLTNAGGILEKLPTQTPNERAKIQQEYFQIFKNIWEENKHTIPLVNSEKILEDGLKRITENKFLLKPETLFYEDTRIGVKEFWSENNWNPLREKIRMLNQFLFPLTPAKTQDQLVDFFNKNFNQPVSLWEFYQKWIPVSETTVDAGNTKFSKIVDLLNNRLATLPMSGSQVHLTPEFLRKFAPILDPPKSYGCLVLPFRKEGKDQVFLDTIVPANARLAGRFLSLFSEENIDAWRRFHSAQAKGNRWIENQDASFFNANVHPSLLSEHLQIPSLSVVGKNKDIPMTQIIVQIDKERNQLLLTHMNQTIEVINLSIEATDNRSGLYQLLCQLESSTPSKNLLLKSINNLYPPSRQGIIQYPRVIYDQQIVLQRSTWFFPKETLPFKPKGSTTTGYQSNLLDWKNTHVLPNQFYYTLNLDYRSESSNAYRNAHKPQFFDFRNPLSIDLWHRDLKKVNQYLKIEEMLPLPNQMVAVDGFKRMVEGLMMF